MDSTFEIFFISFAENNCEINWQRLLDLYPKAKRIHGIKGIDRAHLCCDQLSQTDHYWTIDGDNYLTELLDFNPTVDLHMFKAYDPVFNDYTFLGGIKLWKKSSIINPNMEKGDFCLNATKNKQTEDRSFSRTDYNSNEFDAWKTSFRHCVKLMSPILQGRPNAKNIDFYINRWKSSHLYNTKNAEWCYRGYLDAEKFVSESKLELTYLNKINDYEFLKEFFYARNNNTLTII